MLPDIIDHNAGERLLTFVMRAGADWHALHLHCSGLSRVPRQKDVLTAMGPSLGDHPSSLYFFHDRDVVVVWKGPLTTVLDSILKNFGAYLDEPPRKSYDCYDLPIDRKTVQTLCEHKIAKQSMQQIAAFRAAAQERRLRRVPAILIVEDEAFSSRLLLAFLSRTSETCVATDTEAALEIYLRVAPDIVFLDIELPGVNGVDFAGMITRLDPDAYIVMVTANATKEYVGRSLRNGAKGFIAKPYKKQNITESIETFARARALAS